MTTENSVSYEVQLDRVAGCLIGVALGDAMGMPGELWPRARVTSHFGVIDKFLPGPDGHFVVDGFKAGQFTDDTQQTLMLADAIIESGGNMTAELVATHLVAWADRTGASEGNFLGPSSARSIQKLRDGEDPRKTGSGGETNGAAMRIAPIGIISQPDDVEKLVDNVVEATIMSHDTSIAVAGASLVAGVISAALSRPEVPLDSPAITSCLELGYLAATAGEKRGELVVAASVVERAKLATEIASTPATDEVFLQRLYDIIGASVETSETVPAAVGLLVRGQGDPYRVAVLAANLGGDTDTIGAIATGMAGALSGAKAISADLISTIERVNNETFAQRAERLLEIRNRAY